MLNTELVDLMSKRLLCLQGTIAATLSDVSPAASQHTESIPEADLSSRVAEMGFEIYRRVAEPLINAKDPIPRMGMIVNLYFKNVFKTYQEVTKLKTFLDAVDLEFRSSRGNDKESAKEMLEKLNKLQDSFLPTMLRFRDEIIFAVDPAYRSK